MNVGKLMSIVAFSGLIPITITSIQYYDEIGIARMSVGIWGIFILLGASIYLWNLKL